MIRGIFLAAAFFLVVSAALGADEEKVQFKQSVNAPRDLPEKQDSATVKADQTVDFENYRETLKAWYSARKRLSALESVCKILQSDPASDKEIVTMIELMAIEKKQEVENLRAQLAGLLSAGKLNDPSLSREQREEILVRSQQP